MYHKSTSYKYVLLVVVLNLCTLVSTVRSELLIVKKGINGFVPLDEQDIPNEKAIEEILLKYQWPMSISSDLSKEEQDALLTSQKPYSEELFIQNKIKELSGSYWVRYLRGYRIYWPRTFSALGISDSTEYGVVFIPTALYELFCFIHLFEKKEHENSFQKAVNKFIVAAHNSYGMVSIRPNPWSTEFPYDLLSENKSLTDILKQIYAIYKKANGLFFDGNENESVYISVNNALAATLFNKYPELKTSNDALALSNAIKSNANNLASFLIKELSSWANSPKKYLSLDHERETVNGLKLDAYERLVENLTHEDENKIIAKVIALEYEARELNKALILRGTSFEEFQTGIGEKPEKKVLAGTTLQKEMRRGPYMDSPVISLEKAYGQKIIRPYSISFGNSLFAGMLMDKTASVYYFLASKEVYSRGSTSPSKSTGYALLIDKKAYFQHQVNRLFFIPSLSTISSFVQYGEFFHPRTKVAIALKTREKQTIEGLFGWKMTDPTGVILITRDPLLHAELFSKFLAANGRIIQKGDTSSLIKEEKKFVEKEIKESQIEAAKFYRKLRLITPIIKKKIEKKIEQRKSN